MKFSLISLAVLLSTGLTMAAPNYGSSNGNSCYKCEYRQDDCGRDYGGSYNSCKESFESCYPKPECRNKGCSKCEYKYDDCGFRYGGSYNSCNGGFEYYYKRPYCEKGEGEDEGDHKGKGKGEGEGDGEGKDKHD